MSFVEICDIVPPTGQQCPSQNLTYVPYNSWEITADEWAVLWPAILAILLTAYGFKVLLRLINNR